MKLNGLIHKKKVLKTVPGTQSPLNNCQLLSSHFTDKDFEAWRG